MTVVTHEPDELCDSAFEDLKAVSSLSEKRYHTCKRCMMNGSEIAALLEKINVMVSENDPQCYRRRMSEENGGQGSRTGHFAKGKKKKTTAQIKLQDQVVQEDSSNDVKTAGTTVNKTSPCGKEQKGTPDVDMSGTPEKPGNIHKEERKNPQKEFETLLRSLHLQDKHQQKLFSEDLLKIGPPIKQGDDISEKDLALAFFQTLMVLDYRARYIHVQQNSSDLSDLKSVPTSLSGDSDDEELFKFLTTSEESDQSKQTHVHPIDVQMAVFHCSDSFLKQKIITKLSQCQYALPLLVPDPVTLDLECPLWTFREINKIWKKIQKEENSETVIMKSMPIYKAETPMVLFICLGSLSVSKSQLMNTLINDRYNTFFHRNCPGSTKCRHLMDGVAEIAWYCPAGKPHDSFTDCIAFCNLHGDALINEQQCEVLTEKSSVVVVLVPTLKNKDKSWTVLKGLLKSTKPLILLVEDLVDDASLINDRKYRLGLKDKSQCHVSEELKKIIGQILSGPHTSFQLESLPKVSGVRVDEDETVCQKGKSAAMETVKRIEDMDIAKIKKTFLPCQGELWHKWSTISKELHNLKGDIEKERSQREQQLKQLRQKQCTVSCSKLMESFTKSLINLSQKERKYFLKWTQILMDGISADHLPSILQKYDETWSEVLELKKKHDKTKKLKDKQTELEKLSKELQSATFGLEHIFREMGQIYEAHKSVENQTKRQQREWTKYPELAADLMISGHPMELMDGDAGQVPLTWISSLLQEVIKKLGDQRVFVLSVLGVQSSGKSTMLNAMFGLEFAVSAGRCTKGAFMQLLKLSDEIKKNYKFDYVLVVDTEGLKALELEGKNTLHHDNELATFVVGLGNMTLINIFGENPADMQDILQIVVQAFMRMKKVNLCPGCVFVHQNVTDVAAAEKNMDAKRRLQEKLDKMAQLAAKEEVCDAECFSDVIAFDVQTDVKYFSQLWEGSPPMAPPNPGYSECVQDLKNFILSKASGSSGILLSHFSSKIQDLWNALMSENFVFSFKNTQEITVYRELEVQYGNWTWALRSEMLTIENQLYPSIENGQRDHVELSYLSKEMNKVYDETNKKIAAYFEEDREKEILVQWRKTFEVRINHFYEELIRGVKRKLDEIIQQKKAREKLDAKKTEFEKILLQKSKELAHQLKCLAEDEEDLKMRFNTVWTHWVKELTSDTKPIEDIKLEEDQSVVLQDLGIEYSLIEESKRTGYYKKLPEAGDYYHYITIKKSMEGVWKYVKMSFLPHEENELIRSFINDVEQECLKIIKSKPVATRGFSSTYLQEVAKQVKKRVTEFETQRKYHIRKEFTVDLLLYVFDRTAGWILASHKTYKDNNDALTYLESKKMEYYNIFRSFCKGNSTAVVFGEMMCEKLKVSAVEAICNQTVVDVAGEMRCSFPAFSGNRLNLEKHVLTSLAEKEDFDSFVTYIQNPRKQVETFIKEEVEKYMFATHRDKALNILKKNTDNTIKIISQALFEATENIKKNKGDIDMWVQEFYSSLNNKLTDTINCQTFSDINNFDFVKEEIEKNIENAKKERLSCLSLDDVMQCRQKPDQILIDALCDCCWEKCPFCGAVCTTTMKDHSPAKHSVPFHRASGIIGWHGRGTVDLVVDFCTTLVASDRHFYPEYNSETTFPFKQYPNAGKRYESWSITADASKLTYWKWFVCHFQQKLEEYHKMKFQNHGEIPSEWRKYSKREAIESLDEMCR